MASVFDTAFSGMNASFLSQFGVTATYTPEGGAGKSIQVIVEDPGQELPFPTDVNLKYREMRVQLSSRNDTEGQISVKRLGVDGGAGDTLSIGSETWYVVGLERDGAREGTGLHTLVVRNRKLPRG